jgi:hypothetical protein
MAHGSQRGEFLLPSHNIRATRYRSRPQRGAVRKLLTPVLAGALLLPPALSRAETTVRARVAAPPAATAKIKATRKADHPAIHAAIRSLEKAKAELQVAAHDFGGHKADAIRSVDEALKQLRLADAYNP